MAINRELSQFGRLVTINDNEHIGIGTTSNISIGFGTITATSITASSFIGDGSGLTNLPTGSGGGGGTSSQWTSYATGITTTSNVGIKSTTPTSALDVDGDVKVSGILTTNTLNVTSTGTFLSSGLKIRNPANTFSNTIVSSAIVADRNFTLPLVTSNATFAVINGVTQTFSNANTFSSTLTHSATTTNFSASSYTTGTVTIGGASQTGAITLGQATVSQTLNLATGASGVGTTKTINFGTGGASGSTTLINVGPINESGIISINAGTNLGINSTAPTSKLDVGGDVKVSGIVTATDFNSSSDINLKTNIQTIENPIDKLLEINGVTFNWIENERASVGVIAQDVEKVLPQLVNDMGAHKTVNYNGLIGLLVECIKHQQKQIDELKEHMIGS